MKTYVCSDIHAHWQIFNSFIETLEKDDKVYFLGDAEDKGPEPLQCLQHIMKDKRFTMILGNHDYMMWKICSNLEKSPPYMEREAYTTWVDYNYGGPTLKAYTGLDEKERLKIINFLEECPLYIKDLEVNGKKYDLCHSYMWPIGRNGQTESLSKLENPNNAEYFVWTRPLIPPKYPWRESKNPVIAGHTITYNLNAKIPCEIYHDEDKLEDSKYIDIDCGMAANKQEFSRFAVLCLDDLSVRYFALDA